MPPYSWTDFLPSSCCFGRAKSLIHSSLSTTRWTSKTWMQDAGMGRQLNIPACEVGLPNPRYAGVPKALRVTCHRLGLSTAQLSPTPSSYYHHAIIVTTTFGSCSASLRFESYGHRREAQSETEIIRRQNISIWIQTNRADVYLFFLTWAIDY